MMVCLQFLGIYSTAISSFINNCFIINGANLQCLQWMICVFSHYRREKLLKEQRMKGGQKAWSSKKLQRI